MYATRSPIHTMDQFFWFVLISWNGFAIISDDSCKRSSPIWCVSDVVRFLCYKNETKYTCLNLQSFPSHWICQMPNVLLSQSLIHQGWTSSNFVNMGTLPETGISAYWCHSSQSQHVAHISCMLAHAPRNILALKYPISIINKEWLTWNI